MANQLTGYYVSESYQKIVITSGSDSSKYLTDGAGSLISNLNVTSSNAVSSSYSLTTGLNLYEYTTSFSSSQLMNLSSSLLPLTIPSASNKLVYVIQGIATFNVTTQFSGSSPSPNLSVGSHPSLSTSSAHLVWSSFLDKSSTITKAGSPQNPILTGSLYMYTTTNFVSGSGSISLNLTYKLI